MVLWDQWDQSHLGIQKDRLGQLPLQDLLDRLVQLLL